MDYKGDELSNLITRSFIASPVRLFHIAREDVSQEMSSLCFYPLPITVPTIPIRHIYPQTTHVSAFDKMSNDGRHSAFPRTKMQVGGFRGHSQAIRKIHFVIGSRRMTYV